MFRRGEAVSTPTPRLCASAPVPARFYVDAALAPQLEIDLPAGASRHAQVLRLQPGDAVTLFDGRGGEHAAIVLTMGRSAVRVRVEAFHNIDRELPLHVTLAVGMPANERMDGLVEKATELGVSVLQPLHCQRSVLRLNGERALKKVAHWQAVAQSATEQSGRTRLPIVAPVQDLGAWLAGLPARPTGAGQRPVQGASCDGAGARLVLSLAGASPWAAASGPHRVGATAQRWIGLSGPEGGLTSEEEALARQHGFCSISLGPRVLRADTAPLALLAQLAQLAQLAYRHDRPNQGHE